MTEAARALLATSTTHSSRRRCCRSTPRSARTGRTCRISRTTAPACGSAASTAKRMLRVHDLLRASLSSQGYQKVAGIIRLDDINRAQQLARSAARRDGVREGTSRELRLRQLLRPRFRRPAAATRVGAGSARPSSRRQLHGRRRQDGLPADVRRRHTARRGGKRRDRLVGVGPRSDKRR